jgi:hypothetical protein
MTVHYSEDRKGYARKAGREEVKEILADFLLVFFGTWLLARSTLDWLNGLSMLDELSWLMVAWMVIEAMMSFAIMALGVDRWRAHSRAKKSARRRDARRQEARPEYHTS